MIAAVTPPGDLVFLNILAGVALILFGARFLRKGFDRLLGQNLVAWLQKMTARRLRAFAAGVCIATVAPSSTTLALVAVRMLRSGNLTADRMLAVFLGANIGMTIMVQMLAFKVANAFSVFLVAGVIAFQFLKRELFRGIGQCLLALGFIFMGIFLISGAASAVPPDGAFGQILAILKDYPLVLLLSAALIALLLQSSTATIGLGIALAQGGLGDLELLIPVVLGANLGVACTALVAGWPTLEGRRLGSSNLLLKSCAAALLFLFLFQLMELWSGTPGHAPRQAANFHTAFNVLVALVGLPLVNPIYRLAEKWLAPTPARERAELIERREDFLDEAALESPSMALANATRQTLLMAYEVKTMLENFWICLSTKNIPMARRLQEKDDEVDEMNNEIKRYLSRLSEESMGAKDSRVQLALLSFTSELEAIGDIVDRNLCHQVIKQEGEGENLSPDDTERLRLFYERIMRRFEMAINVLATRNKNLAVEILSGKDSAKDFYLSLQKDHYAALKHHEPGSLDGSSYFIDMLNALRRISGHLTSIGYHFAGETKLAEQEVMLEESLGSEEAAEDRASPKTGDARA